ncbi:MAG: alpha/beta hydrolase [Bacillus sp. (in: Bacteria)]|nr:alpha/beta hydrolase [Bacillus sp. (in: firmicutes)]
MQSIRSYFLKNGIKLGVRRLNRKRKSSGAGLEERRKLLNATAKKWIKMPANCKVEPFQIDGIYAEWISNNQTVKDKVILYLHGGAYGYCSAETHRSLAARIMNETGVKVLLPEYRLAPEHPFPAALEDTLIVYHWLLNQGFDPSTIIFAGDSAGGGLSVAATLLLKDRNEPLPAAVICLSPWVDLTSSGDSYSKNKYKDPYLSLGPVKKAAQSYAGSERLDHKFISPVFGDFSGFPPLHIQVGSVEILLSDAEKLAHQAELTGVNVTLTVWKGMWHVFQMSRRIPEARKAIKEISKFVKKTFAL